MLDQLLPADIVAVEANNDSLAEPLLPEEAALMYRASPARLREFTIARGCARRALGKLGFPSIPILRGSSRQPLWPDGIVGSITHSRAYYAAAVARRTRLIAIGIDAEVNEPLPPGVLAIIARDEEVAWLNRRLPLSICWDRALFSAKESVFKAWFPITGRWLAFEDVSVDFEFRSNRFRARFLAEKPIVDGREITSFDGKVLVQAGQIVTAVSVERRPSSSCIG